MINVLLLSIHLETKTLNGVIIKLNGRYPDKGTVVNMVCKEMGYVIKGSGKVVVENKKTKIEEGDLVLIEPKEKYYWEGNLELFVPCTPAWYPEQHKEIS